MVASQVMSESLGWLPNVGTWLGTGRDSRASHGEGKSIQGGNMLHGECGPSWKAQHQGMGLSVCIGVGYFIG